MASYLVVFAEAGGPETYLENTKEKAVERIQRLRDECGETDEDMERSVVIYEVTKFFSYKAPTEKAGLVNEKVL